jgi:hypothetical protein
MTLNAENFMLVYVSWKHNLQNNIGAFPGKCISQLELSTFLHSAVICGIHKFLIINPILPGGCTFPALIRSVVVTDI